ncbi:hypothetical protein L7F22_033368 [Adiantum nelumboides]|nr:hypothetical protein [Adiantum nelumboides]
MASGEDQSHLSTSGDAGGDHNEDYGNEYGPPLPTQEELREIEHRRLVGEATNMMLNFAKDPNLAKYMTETAFQDVHAQWKAATTSPQQPYNKKQYSEKELVEESTFDKAKKHKKRIRFAEFASSSSSSSSFSSDNSSNSSEEDRKGKKQSKKQRHRKGKKKARKSKFCRVDDSSTEDTSTDNSDSEDGHFYANKKNFYKANQYDFLEDKSKKVREFKEVADVRNRHGVCNARAFGSFTMDMFTSSSDLDISLNVECGPESLARQDGVNLLKKMTKLLYKLQSCGIVRDIQPVLKAKVPVVKFIHSKTGIECDVSVENRDGMIKSELLRIFSTIDSRFRKLCFLLKAWANAHGINSSKDHTLNSLSLILLAALHLQTRVPAILPPFSSLLKGLNSTVYSDAASLVERQVKAYKDFGKKNSESVVQLFSSFLSKVVAVKDLWQEGLCASAYEGTWTLTDSPSWMFVEDFTSLSQNAARAVNGVGFEAIYDSCNQALAYLRDYFLGVHEAHSVKNLLFDLHISSAVHKRKRNKGSQARALDYQSIQVPLEDPFMRIVNRRPEQIRGNFLDRDHLTQMGYGSIQERPAKRLKLQHAQNGDEYKLAFTDRPPLPDKSVMVPSQVYLERHLRENQLLLQSQRRQQMGEPRFYMPPISPLSMYERRHVLEERAAGAYVGAPAMLPALIPTAGIPLYAESSRPLNQIFYQNTVPLYGYSTRFHDRL